MVRLTCTVREACEASGLGPSSIYKALKNNELQRLKIGRRTLIKCDQLRSWLENTTAAQKAA